MASLGPNELIAYIGTALRGAARDSAWCPQSRCLTFEFCNHVANVNVMISQLPGREIPYVLLSQCSSFTKRRHVDNSARVTTRWDNSTGWLCLVLLFYYQIQVLRAIVLTIFVRVASMILGQSCDAGHPSVSNHQPHDCLLNRLFRHRSKKT